MPRGPYAKYTTKTGTETFTAEDADEIQVPSATLVNGRTAGEAELFAGVLQDSGKTQVIGTATAGKSTVQELIPIESDKSAVRLTVGGLSLIQSGTSWQDTGIQPAKVVEMPENLLPYAALLTDEEDPQILAGRAVLESSTHSSTTTAPTEPTEPTDEPSATDPTGSET